MGLVVQGNGSEQRRDAMVLARNQAKNEYGSPSKLLLGQLPLNSENLQLILTVIVSILSYSIYRYL